MKIAKQEKKCLNQIKNLIKKDPHDWFYNFATIKINPEGKYFPIIKMDGKKISNFCDGD